MNGKVIETLFPKMVSVSSVSSILLDTTTRLVYSKESERLSE